MRETSSGFGVLRIVLGVVAVVVLLFVAFWVALIAIGVGVVYFLARAIVRSITGRGRGGAQTGETIVIQPGHRANYDNGNVIVLPVTGGRQ